MKHTHVEPEAMFGVNALALMAVVDDRAGQRKDKAGKVEGLPREIEAISQRRRRRGRVVGGGETDQATSERSSAQTKEAEDSPRSEPGMS